MTDTRLSRYVGKTVVITGARGYLGSALTEAMLQARARVIRVGRKPLPPMAGTETLQANPQTVDCWKRIVSCADIVFHLAGNTSVYTAAREPADSVNCTVLPIAHLVGAARASGCRPRVVFASTATVYGLTGNQPVSEKATPRPITNYDLHKLFAERQLELATAQEFVEGVSLRLANVYGPSPGHSSSDDRGILNRIAKTALQGGTLTIYGTGEYVRDYVYITDVIQAFVAAGIEKGVTGRSFNVASGEGVTVRGAFHLVAERAEALTGRTVPIEAVPWPDGADPIEFRSFVADVSGLRDAAGWRPSVGLREGIDRMLAHFYGKAQVNQFH